MTIEVDGERRARGWREFQTVFGGATLGCSIGSHRIEARIVQPWAVQSYSFSLEIDGRIHSASDNLPDPRTSRRETLVQIGYIAGVVAVLTTLVGGLWPVSAIVAAIMAAAAARSRLVGGPPRGS